MTFPILSSIVTKNWIKHENSTIGATLKTWIRNIKRTKVVTSVEILSRKSMLVLCCVWESLLSPLSDLEQLENLCVRVKVHNCQKWKSRFFKWPCHKIYRVEAVSNYTFKITIFVSMWNLEHFVKNWYFVNNLLIKKFEYKNPSVYMWHIKVCLSTAHNIAFLLNWFVDKYKFPFKILRFLHKITLRYSKIGISRKCF